MMMTSQENETIFTKYSFNHLSSMSSIYMNESLIVKYKCVFMHELEREMQRNIADKYIFFKSLNLISEKVSFNDEASVKSKCDLVFHLFQFRLHLNLKTDFEYELFFDSCKNVLINRENNFNHNKRKCVQTFLFKDKEKVENVEFVQPILLIFSNWYFLLTIALFLSFLGPVFCLVVRYELFSNLISKMFKDSQNRDEKLVKELKLEIERKRASLKKRTSEYQKSNVTERKQLDKAECDLFYLDGLKISSFNK